MGDTTGSVAEEQSTAPIKATTPMMELLDLNREMNQEKVMQQALCIILDFIVHFDVFKTNVMNIYHENVKMTK